MKKRFDIQQYYWISKKDRAILARQLSLVLQSGLALVQALRTILHQTHKPAIKLILEKVIDDLEKGHNFSQSIVKHPEMFDRFFVAVVKSGEASGKLDKVMEDIAKQLEEEVKFSGEIRSAMIYPIFIVFTLFIVGIIMSIYVMPNLSTLFVESNISLPWTTTILFAITGFIGKSWLWLLLIIAFIGSLIYFYNRTDSGRLTVDYFKLRIPGISGLLEEIYMVRFSRGLEMLVKSGIPIIEAMEIMGEVMANEIYKKSLKRVNEELAKGIPMSVPLSQDPLFPIMVPQMLAIGEKTGQMENSLRGLGDFFQNTAGAKIKTLSSMFEPVLIVILGLGVAFVVFSIIMPIYQIANA